MEGLFDNWDLILNALGTWNRGLFLRGLKLSRHSREITLERNWL